ncbi:hypothetical protein [Herbiconiux solani]|uniref:hypothetical protein n=1 Tax=Herbiconiux solani TaxID=661329 RepID=UPI00082698FE|nr:hypothetical protein [Herbiconiux solani]
MATSESDDLQTRAYGPGQPPLTDAERAELHRRHAAPAARTDPAVRTGEPPSREQTDPARPAPAHPDPAEPDPDAAGAGQKSGPASSPRWKPAVIALSAAAALAAVAVISAAAGFAAGSADRTAADSAPAATDAAAGTTTAGSAGRPSAYPEGNADLGDGIIAADGTWLPFTDADCDPILAVETAALAGVTCTWPDGHSVALGADGSVSTDTTALVTQDKEDPFRLTPP